LKVLLRPDSFQNRLTRVNAGRKPQRWGSLRAENDPNTPETSSPTPNLIVDRGAQVPVQALLWPSLAAVVLMGVTATVVKLFF